LGSLPRAHSVPQDVGVLLARARKLGDVQSFEDLIFVSKFVSKRSR